MNGTVDYSWLADHVEQRSAVAGRDAPESSDHRFVRTAPPPPGGYAAYDFLVGGRAVATLSSPSRRGLKNGRFRVEWVVRWGEGHSRSFTNDDDNHPHDTARAWAVAHKEVITQGKDIADG